MARGASTDPGFAVGAGRAALFGTTAVVARCQACADHRPGHQAPALAFLGWHSGRGRWSLRINNRRWNYVTAAELVERLEAAVLRRAIEERHDAEPIPNRRGRRVNPDDGKPWPKLSPAQLAAQNDPDWPSNSHEEDELILPLEVIGADAPRSERERVLAVARQGGRVYVTFPQSDGVELRCEDCGHRPRYNKKKLYDLAAVAREHGRDEIFV